MTDNEIASAVFHDFQVAERVEMIARVHRDKSRTPEAKWATRDRKAARRAKGFLRTVKGA